MKKKADKKNEKDESNTWERIKKSFHFFKKDPSIIDGIAKRTYKLFNIFLLLCLSIIIIIIVYNIWVKPIISRYICEKISELSLSKKINTDRLKIDYSKIPSLKSEEQKSTIAKNNSVIVQTPGSAGSHRDFGDLQYYKDYLKVGDLLDTVNDILLYFSIFIITLTLLAGILGVKLFAKYREFEKSIEKADNAVLESALVTIVTVPMTLPTQITSVSFMPAINEITRVVNENRKLVEKKSKYVPIRLIESLYYWLNDDLHKSDQILEDTVKYCESKEWGKIIAFYRGRIFRQLAYDNKESSNKKIVEYLDKCREQANLMEKQWENLFNLSIALLEKDEFKMTNINTDYIIDKIINCFMDDKDGEKIYDLNSLIAHLQEKDINPAVDVGKQLAITMLVLRDDLKRKIKLDNSTIEKCSKNLLDIYESSLNEILGINVYASIYYTMTLIAKNTADRDKFNKFKKLALLYTKKCKDTGIKKLQITELCINIGVEDFERKLREINYSNIK